MMSHFDLHIEGRLLDDVRFLRALFHSCGSVLWVAGWQ